jgi:signal transduction histidine kinase
LAATIAHEINNPLAAVLTYIRLLMKLTDQNQFASERREDISRYLATMESETSRCGEIVKNLLAFSRQSKMSIEKHNIAHIIDKTLALIDHDLEMKEIELKKTIEPDLPDIPCDFKQIQQVLLNIMYNASEAMPEGGMLTITAGKSTKPGEFVEIDISDTGCGIAGEHLENIFEPFFTTKEEGKGVGLGLSVVYGIVIRHNGTITVESELEKGSTFTVCLPCENSVASPRLESTTTR